MVVITQIDQGQLEQNRTNTRLSLRQLDKNELGEFTTAPQLNEQEEQKRNEAKITEFSPLIREDGTMVRTNDVASVSVFGGDTASQEYISFKLQILLSQLHEELEVWKNEGMPKALIHVRNIKQILKKHYGYLSKKSETRILVNALELVFENNNWSSLDSSQLSILQEGLKGVTKGKAENESLSTFFREVQAGGISFLK